MGDCPLVGGAVVGDHPLVSGAVVGDSRLVGGAVVGEAVVGDQRRLDTINLYC